MCRRAAGAPAVARLTVANESFAWTTGESQTICRATQNRRALKYRTRGGGFRFGFGLEEAAQAREEAIGRSGA